MFYISENTFEQIIFFCLYNILCSYIDILRFFSLESHILNSTSLNAPIFPILQFPFLQYNVLAAHYQSHIYYYIHYVRIVLKNV